MPGAHQEPTGRLGAQVLTVRQRERGGASQTLTFPLLCKSHDLGTHKLIYTVQCLSAMKIQWLCRPEHSMNPSGAQSNTMHV